jgi:hypothetical protein
MSMRCRRHDGAATFLPTFFREVSAMKKLAAAIVLVVAVSSVPAADPPALVNYQGVLRDASDKPRAGTFDMVFRFYDALSAGSEILVDAHTGGGGNAVIVSGGLFNVQLGGGTLTDGSGAGTYASLDQVFRDYGTVYLQITVGAETLSPRIRIQSAAYAFNASNLQGKPASSFLDTTSSTQTKSGHLNVNGGFDASVASGVALNANGTQTGGAFGANGAFAYVADTGFIKTGIRAQGDDAGGYFKDNNSSGTAYVAHGDYGIDATGTSAGGYFSDNGYNYAYLGQSGGYGLSANGTLAGGSFFSTGFGNAYLALGNTGINAGGAPAGHFHTYAGAGSIDLATGDFGALGHGRYPGAGAYFDDPNASGKCWIGFGDEGIYGIGAYAGGYFTRSYHNVEAILGSSDAGGNPIGVYGHSNEAGAYPGFFADDYVGSYTWVGANGSKVIGVGSVNFIQNHPTDATKTIVYAAPEGDEVAVYTRGSARLVNGEAKVALGETFKWVTNPDIGLTAHLTPRDEPVALAVVAVSPGELLVRGPAGSTATFDYLVYGLRVGFEDRAVVQTKRQEAYIPSHSVEEDEYAKAPELRSYSALSRYTRMRRALTGSALAPDLTASKALESAIHVFNRATDARGPHPDGLHPAPTAPAPPPAAAPGGRPAPAASAAALAQPVAPTTAPEILPAASRRDLTLVGVSETVEPGDVVANDPQRLGELRRASTAADPGVVGIVAGDTGTSWSEKAPLVFAGSVSVCKVDASYGPIVANDLLVASPTAGHAMRAGDDPKQGTVVGKALEPWEAGTGTIRVLVMSR